MWYRQGCGRVRRTRWLVCEPHPFCARPLLGISDSLRSRISCAIRLSGRSSSGSGSGRWCQPTRLHNASARLGRFCLGGARTRLGLRRRPRGRCARRRSSCGTLCAASIHRSCSVWSRAPVNVDGVDKVEERDSCTPRHGEVVIYRLGQGV